MIPTSHVKDLMLDFNIPEVLKDDIVYCQYSLRYFLKIHQLWANKIFTKVTEVMPARRILKKIEAEMHEIGVEQNFLTKILRNLLTGHCDMLRSKNYSNINMELINGFVARTLSLHYENYYATIKATNVKSRLEPTYLSEKFGPDFMENTNKEFQLQSYQSSELAYNEQESLQNSKQQSLLKPKEERDKPKDDKDEEPNFLEKRMHFRQMQAERDKQQKLYIALTNAVGATSTTTAPAAAVATATKPSTIIVRPNTITVRPNTITVRPNMVTVRPNMANVRPNTVIIKPVATLRPAPLVVHKKINPLTGKQMLAEPQILKYSKSKETVAISNSRMNLLQALNKAKSQKLTPKIEDSAAKPSTSETTAAKVTRLSKSKSTSPSPSSLNDSDERNSLIAEADNNTPTDEKDITQERFLKFFGLHTLEYSNYLKTHKFSKRRRNNKTTERSDFHYGADAYEFYKQQSKNRNKRVNKKSILYSPPQTRNQINKKRASEDDPAVIAKKSRIAAVGAEDELQENPCIVCQKKGSTNTLSACVYCYNFFHLSCHRSAGSEPLRERENICPFCYKKKQINEKMAAQLKLDSQKRNRARQHTMITEIWNKLDSLEKKLHEKSDEKKQLLREKQRTEHKIKYLWAIVEQFSKKDEREVEQTKDIKGKEPKEDVMTDDDDDDEIEKLEINENVEQNESEDDEWEDEEEN